MYKFTFDGWHTEINNTITKIHTITFTIIPAIGNIEKL